MSVEMLLPPEHRNIPQGFTTLIVDDDYQQGEYTSKALESASQTVGLRRGPIIMAQNPVDTFYKALTAKSGNQVDIVLLDHLYEGKTWQPDTKSYFTQLLGLGSQTGVDLNNYAPLYAKRGREQVVVMGKMPSDLYNIDGIHLAILLRLFGYNNDLFLVSGDPREAYEIVDEMNKLHKAVSSYQPRFFPLDGYAQKDDLGRDKRVHWGRSLKKMGQDLVWNDLLNISDKGLPDGLAHLLSR